MAQDRAGTARRLEIQRDSSLQLLQAEFIKQMSKYQQLAEEEPFFAELSEMGYSCARLADGLQNIPLLLLPTGVLSSVCLVISLSVHLSGGVSTPGCDPVLPGSASTLGGGSTAGAGGSQPRHSAWAQTQPQQPLPAAASRCSLLQHWRLAPIACEMLPLLLMKRGTSDVS